MSSKLEQAEVARQQWFQARSKDLAQQQSKQQAHEEEVRRTRESVAAVLAGREHERELERIRQLSERKHARPRGEYRQYQTVNDKMKLFEQVDEQELGLFL